MPAVLVGGRVREIMRCGVIVAGHLCALPGQREGRCDAGRRVAARDGSQ